MDIFWTFYCSLTFFKKKIKLAIASVPVTGFTLRKYPSKLRLFMINQ